MVNVKAFLDSLLVIVAAATHLSAFHQSVNKFLLGNLKTCLLYTACASFLEQCLESFGLCYGAGKSIEDHAILCLLFVVINHFCKNVDHELIGDELPLIDESFGCLAKLGTALDVVAQHVASRNVKQLVVFNQFLALGALARARCTKYYYVQHNFMVFNKLNVYSSFLRT